MGHKTDLFAFTDYRAFLNCHVADCRKDNPDWTYDVWTEQLGLADNSSIIKIVRGQRHPGPKLMSRLNDYFNFNANQSSYFQSLVDLAKNKNKPEKAFFILDNLQKTARNSNFQIFDMNRFNLVSHWKYYLIRQMTFLKDFGHDLDWIHSRLLFKITPKEIKETIELMLKENLLIEKNGSLQCSAHSINTTDGISNEALKRFHECSLDNAKSSIRKVPVEYREHLSFTMAIDEKNLSKAKEFLREISYQFDERFSEEFQADQVYQLQIQFYPLTKDTRTT